MGKYRYAIGRRKTAVARVRLFDAPGTIVVNFQELPKYFQTKTQQKILLAPLNLLGIEGKLTAQIYIYGGGKQAQAEAGRLALARALLLRNPEDRPTLKKSGFLTRDSRVKERKKPGLKRARRGPQWAKR
ncbi:MAG: 30S ribosomal protein S9 [Candidatus Doudnabacteria bacterium]|nr:30S ribosomal protein S9 [Candidatus Doudnabacteria bacterium]